MKSTILSALAALLLSVSATAQSANTALSNLATTSVNADLVPGSSNARSFGSSSKFWKDLYLGNLLYMGGARMLTFTADISKQNTGLGAFSMASTSTGYNNTGLGAYTLRANTAGFNNVAIGYTSLFKSVNGHNNIGIGVASLYSTTSGVSNTGVGNSALTSNTTGSNNMGLGANALGSNTTGSANIGIGIRAMFTNKTNNYQVAIGDSALFNNNGGAAQNVAVGSKALYTSTTGAENTAVGFQAITNNTTGGNNSAFGYKALTASTYGGSNTAIGSQALLNSTSGFFNTAMGLNALANNTTGNNNVGIGGATLYALSTGSGNTALGTYADVTDGTLQNATAIGYYAKATASNQIMLGSTNVSSIVAAGNTMLYSDGRFKTDVTENVPGLAFIKALRPVTYHYNVHGMNQKMGLTNMSNDPAMEKAAQEKEKKIYSGFIAQEVEKTAASLKYEFSGVHIPENDKDLYALSYSDFVVPIVKGMQELSAKNDSLTAKNSALAATNDSLKQRLDKIEAFLNMSGNGSGISLSDAKLLQNTPNPFVSSTTISYVLPRTFGRAKISVVDMTGRVIRTVAVTGQGRGNLAIDAASLSAGVYSYTLSVDDKIVETKQMILSK